MFEIKNWIDISDNFSEVLLLGNGASVSVDKRFLYKSLRDHAIENGFLTEDVQSVFGHLHTDDFEFILRVLWHANSVNKALGVEDDKTKVAYEGVRDCLINVVRSIHPTYEEVSDQLPLMYGFLKRFDRVISLNYDLLVYWTMMYGYDVPDHHAFKDCFIRSSFVDDWPTFRNPIRDEHECTLVFYPHGNLILARDKIENERKLLSQGKNLLDQILERWNSGSYVPLFVSEGTVAQKIKSIHGSYYLNTVFREVLTNEIDSIVVYGWSFGEQDVHILERLARSSVKRIAVSIHQNNQADCARINQLILDKISSKIEVFFFDASSHGCWNHPANT